MIENKQVNLDKHTHQSMFLKVTIYSKMCHELISILPKACIFIFRLIKVRWGT